jgi:NAD-dependent deacetylase
MASASQAAGSAQSRDSDPPTATNKATKKVRRFLAPLEGQMWKPETIERIRSARSVAVLTGAGISAESGVPTFRDPEGLWSKFQPEELASMAAFMKNPRLVSDWYKYRRDVISRVEPNAGHRALAELEKLKADFVLVTQNVDDLHRRAGQRNVIELHGNITRSLCIDCGKFDDPDHRVSADGLPRCISCNGLLRPDVVWFGEMLPEDAWSRAVEAFEFCDVCLVVGTSGAVYPAASLPLVARQNGAFAIEVNPRPSEISEMLDESILAAAGVALPALLQKLLE